MKYLEQYQEFYDNGGYENNDPVIRAKDDIKEMLKQFQCKSLIDYGCGHGTQYNPPHNLHQYWGLTEIYRYDPGVRIFNNKPIGLWDAVINTDVLEHIPEEFVRDVIKEIYSYATKFEYFQIATSPAKAILPNGENAHCTLKSHQEWVDIIQDLRGDIPTVVKTTGRYRERDLLE
jgi:hypothetical protein